MTIELNWTRNDDSTDGGWDVERSTDGGTTWNTIASNLSPNTTSYTDSNTDSGNTYTYQVTRFTDHTSSTSSTASVSIPYQDYFFYDTNNDWTSNQSTTNINIVDDTFELSNQTSGTLVTSKKKGSFEVNRIEFEINLPTEGQVNATIYQDTTFDGTANNSETKNDITSGTYKLSSFESTNSEYWIEFNLSTTDTSKTPSIDLTVLSRGAVLPWDAMSDWDRAQSESNIAHSGSNIELGEVEGMDSFTTVGSHTWNNPGVNEVEVLVVGGGGGGGGSAGGSAAGGGGGAGGLIKRTNYSVSGDQNVTVGAGGAGGRDDSDDDGDNGGNSEFGGLIANGGGGGGARETTSGGKDGGSGGGAGSRAGAANGGTGSQGSDGGDAGFASSGSNPGAGGGGYSQTGESVGNTGAGGSGGDGYDASDSFGTTYGESGWFAGGGGGGDGNSGGGGAGGQGGGGSMGSNATNNTGGGGGGQQYSGGPDAGDGGSGIVLVKYNQRQQSGSLKTPKKEF